MGKKRISLTIVREGGKRILFDERKGKTICVRKGKVHSQEKDVARSETSMEGPPVQEGLSHYSGKKKKKSYSLKGGRSATAEVRYGETHSLEEEREELTNKTEGRNHRRSS